MALFTCNFVSNVLLSNTEIKVFVPSITMTEAIGNRNLNGVTDLSVETAYPDKMSHYYRSKDKYPVLYLLHGGGKDAESWFQYTRAAIYAEEKNIALVAISAQTNPVVDIDNIPLMSTFLTREVRDFVCGMFPISDKPEHSYVAGLSMGGFGVLANLVTHPDLFAAAGAFSPVCDLDFAMMGNRSVYKNEGKYDIIQIAKSHVKNGIGIPPLYLATGDEDFLYPDILKLKEAYAELGQPLEWVVAPGVPHEWRFWDQQLESFLNWIPRTDPYANSKRVI